MNIQKLSTKYIVKRIEEKDYQDVLIIMLENPLYFTYCPPFPTIETIYEDTEALPPNKGFEDKYYIGYFQEGMLIAIMDIVVGYPKDHIVYLGFFMMKKSKQGKGEGTLIIQEALEYMKELGYKEVRLAYAKGNNQSKCFWEKNGFAIDGVTSDKDEYTAIEMRKEL